MKRFFIILTLLAMFFTPAALWAGSCSAYATTCSASCSVYEPNNETLCIGGSTSADCLVYNANGSLNMQKTQRDNCIPGPC